MPSKPRKDIVAAVTALIREGRADTIREACRMIDWPDNRYGELKRWLSSEKISVKALKRPMKEVVIPLEADTEKPVASYADLPQPHNVLMRAAVFDIETTDFGTDGYEGTLVCCSVFPLDAEKPHTLKLEYNDRDDRRLLGAVMAELGEYDILIGHYVLGFDLPWLASRLAYHRMPPPRRWFIADTCTWARALKLTTSKKLGNLIDYFRIPGAEKTAIQRTTWSHVRSRFEDEFNMAISDIVHHCETDVISNRGVFNHLYPRVMSARYSSSNPLTIFNGGMGVAHWYEEGAAK